VSDADPPVRLDRVLKRFGDVTALDGVSLELRAGEILALLGPNGAGKTTAIGVVLGLRRPDAGEARLFGRDPREPASRRRVGSTPQELDFPGTLTVTEVLDFAGRHFPERADVGELLARFGLEDVARRQCGGLSGGQRRRLAVALAFVGDPVVVVLDEPTTGLDVEARKSVWDAIRSHRARGGSALLTTHYLEEAEALALRVVVLVSGRIVCEGRPREIARAHGNGSLEDAFLSLAEADA
jgi:ABC-2 type transport system ATP-binding protein